jgi:hypothetical protein
VIWTLSIISAVALVGILVCVWAYRKYDNGAPIAIGFMLALVAIGALGPLAWCPLAVRHDRSACQRFGSATEREVKFARYSFFTWEGLVLTDEGWIARDNLYVDERGQR